jgi:hypothetical protein
LYFAECRHPEEYDRAERGDDSICTQVPTAYSMATPRGAARFRQ